MDLEAVQAEYAKGNFRRWAFLLGAALRIGARLGTDVLTPKVYRLARAKLVAPR